MKKNFSILLLSPLLLSPFVLASCSKSTTTPPTESQQSKIDELNARIANDGALAILKEEFSSLDNNKLMIDNLNANSGDSLDITLLSYDDTADKITLIGNFKGETYTITSTWTSDLKMNYQIGSKVDLGGGGKHVFNNNGDVVFKISATGWKTVIGSGGQGDHNGVDLNDFINFQYVSRLALL